MLVTIFNYYRKDAKCSEQILYFIFNMIPKNATTNAPHVQGYNKLGTFYFHKCYERYTK